MILVTGGYVTGPSDTIKTTELYDPVHATWTTGPSLITERGDFTATTLNDGTILVAGGQNATENNIPSTELYDPSTGLLGTWNLTLLGVPGYMVTPRSYHTATLIPSTGKVLVAGGSSATVTNLTDSELYDPATHTWSATGSLATGRYSHTSTLISIGTIRKVLVVGGFGGATNTQNPLPLNTAELYDPATGVWTPAANLNIARANHTATLLSNGMVLVVGGETLSSVVLSSAELYDPANNTWTQINSLGNAREWHTATLLSDGLSVMVIGGVNAGSEVMPIEVYNSSTGTWASAASLNTGRDTFTATLIPSTGKVLVAGGYNFPSSSSLNSVELH
jgi:N-acetylneuraminic acid mutarotase